MAKIHFLNVDEGDCSIIEHDNGNVTMIDICCGNVEEKVPLTEMFSADSVNRLIVNLIEYPYKQVRF